MFYMGYFIKETENILQNWKFGKLEIAVLPLEFLILPNP